MPTGFSGARGTLGAVHLLFRSKAWSWTGVMKGSAAVVLMAVLSIGWLDMADPQGFPCFPWWVWAFFRVGGACLVGYYFYHAYMALKHDPNGDGRVDAWQQIQESYQWQVETSSATYGMRFLTFVSITCDEGNLRPKSSEINDLTLSAFLLAWWTAMSIFQKVLTVCVYVLSLVTVPPVCFTITVSAKWDSTRTSNSSSVDQQTWHILTFQLRISEILTGSYTAALGASRV